MLYCLAPYTGWYLTVGFSFIYLFILTVNEQNSKIARSNIKI